MTKPLLIIGGGGHATVLFDVLKQQHREVIGFVCPSSFQNSEIFNDVSYFAHDEDVFTFNKNDIKLVNGIGSLPGGTLRASIFNYFGSYGYKFETIVAPRSIVSSYAKLHEGVQVMAGAIIQTGTIIGENTIINTGAIVDHDCNIGKNNHIAPGATLSGLVTSRDGVHIGTGASIIQSVVIEKNAVIGAGATVTKNVPENTICYPSRITTKVNK